MSFLLILSQDKDIASGLDDLVLSTLIFVDQVNGIRAPPFPNTTHELGHKKAHEPGKVSETVISRVTRKSEAKEKEARRPLYSIPR